MSHTLVHTHAQGRNILSDSLQIADSFFARSKGLLGRREFPMGEGLWIKSCNSIHTFFMRFALDAVFVDRELRVVSVHHSLKPWRITPLYFKATSVFELPAGTLEQFGTHAPAPGDQLIVETAQKPEVNGGQHG